MIPTVNVNVASNKWFHSKSLYMLTHKGAPICTAYNCNLCYFAINFHFSLFPKADWTEISPNWDCRIRNILYYCKFELNSPHKASGRQPALWWVCQLCQQFRPPLLTHWQSLGVGLALSGYSWSPAQSFSVQGTGADVLNAAARIHQKCALFLLVEREVCKKFYSLVIS